MFPMVTLVVLLATLLMYMFASTYIQLQIQFPSQNIDTHPISKPQYCYTGELKNWYAGAICRIHIMSGMQAGGDHEMKKYN